MVKPNILEKLHFGIYYDGPGIVTVVYGQGLLSK